eukprot:1914328-Rhodomonas_salina.1
MKPCTTGWGTACPVPAGSSTAPEPIHPEVQSALPSWQSSWVSRSSMSHEARWDVQADSSARSNVAEPA